MKGTEISNLKATITEFENKTNELQRKLHDQEQTARNKIREATKMGRVVNAKKVVNCRKRLKKTVSYGPKLKS